MADPSSAVAALAAAVAANVADSSDLFLSEIKISCLD